MRIAIVVLALAVAACGGGAESTKFKQTWTKSYGQTTCADWANVMDDHQKFVMAGDFLLTAQRGDKASAGLPGDALIGKFQGFIDGVCLRADAATTGITTAAFLAYNSSDQFKP